MNPFERLQQPQEAPPSGKEILLTLLVVLILVGLLAACAPLPKCPVVKITSFTADDGNRYHLLDDDNWMRLLANVYGLSEQKCRLIKGEEV